MNYYELEHKYNHFQKEYLFYKDESIQGIICIVLTYFTYLYSFISNKEIFISYLMYALCIYCVFWTIYDLIKLKKMLKEMLYYDNEIYKIFIQEYTTNK